MIYADDLHVGGVTACSSYRFSREEIVDFARRYDPQPFHMDDEAARKSLFGRLTASGLHSGCAARQLALQHMLNATRFLGSPGGKLLQMHKPVYPGSEVHVRLTIRGVHWLAAWPGVALVDCLTQGFDSAGELVITLEDLAWIGSRALPASCAASLLAAAESASAPLGSMQHRLELQPAASTGEKRLYWEDCPPGTTYRSRQFAVSASEVESFRAQFDPDSAAGGLHHPNEWHVTCLAMRALADEFWLKLEHVGGTGTESMRWMRAVQAGDRLHCELTILHARPLRSRPGVGVVNKRSVCANQSGQVVTSFTSTTFLRMRAGR